MHTCPMTTGTVPHVGGPILPVCMPNVLIGGMPAARVGDPAFCTGPPDLIVQGSSTVLIGGQMAARMGDMTVHGGVIVIGDPTVLIGDRGGGEEDDEAEEEDDEASAKTGGVSGSAAGTPKGFSSKETKDHLTALSNAKAMLLKAKTDLNKWDPATQARSKKWFGDASPKTRQLMQTRVDNEISQIGKMGAGNFYRAEKGEEDCYAYVYPKDNTKVYIGNDFGPAPATGADSKAGTLVHELSHYKSVGGTKDNAYGKTASQALAKSDPAKAQNNADSFEYFVEGQ
jgi:uncharacterized Zn-binding protein involved in type VI secretion